MKLAAELDRHPGIWRGGELARTACPGIATGFVALDVELPGGGYFLIASFRLPT